MSSIVPFPIGLLDDTTVLRIFPKMSPVSYVRMRQTCRRMNAIAEKHSKHMKIFLFRINISPELYLPAGFCAEEIQWRWARTEFMEPVVLEEYMTFLKERAWITGAATSVFTPKDILEIIQPRCLRLYGSQSTIPKSTKTVVVYSSFMSYETWKLREYPENVENLIIDDRCPLSVYDLGYWPQLIRDIAMAFYEDQLPLSFIQVKRVAFRRELVMINEPRDDSLLYYVASHVNLDPCIMFRRFLKNTPYHTVETHPFFHTKSLGQKGYDANHTQWISTSNIRWTSRTGNKALFAVRMETDAMRADFLFMSLYLWKNRCEFLMPTVDYLEMEADEVEWLGFRGNVLGPDNLIEI